MSTQIEWVSSDTLDGLNRLRNAMRSVQKYAVEVDRLEVDDHLWEALTDALVVADEFLHADAAWLDNHECQGWRFDGFLNCRIHGNTIWDPGEVETIDCRTPDGQRGGEHG